MLNDALGRAILYYIQLLKNTGFRHIQREKRDLTAAKQSQPNVMQQNNSNRKGLQKEHNSETFVKTLIMLCHKMPYHVILGWCNKKKCCNI